MKAPKLWKLVPAVLACCAVGLASAKLPAPTEDQKAKAEEAKAKATEATKKENELLGKSQDRATEHYKKTKGGVVKTVAPVAAPQKQQKP